jgi:hypothetical protein
MTREAACVRAHRVALSVRPLEPPRVEMEGGNLTTEGSVQGSVTRHRVIAALALAAVFTLTACHSSTARSASCTGGHPVVLTATVDSAHRLTVHGLHFTVCHDTNHSPPGPGMSGIPLVLQQGTRSAHLATVDAHGDLGEFTTTITLPRGFTPGPAAVKALSDQTVVMLPSN